MMKNVVMLTETKSGKAAIVEDFETLVDLIGDSEGEYTLTVKKYTDAQLRDVPDFEGF